MSRKTDRQIDRKSDKLGLVEASIRSDEGRNARNVRFRISLRWPIHIINPIDKAKLFCNTPHRRSTAVFVLESFPLYSDRLADKYVSTYGLVSSHFYFFFDTNHSDVMTLFSDFLPLQTQES